MNYKKSIAFILALAICLPVVAGKTYLVSHNNSVSANENDDETDSTISYKDVYTYNDKLELSPFDEGYYVEFSGLDSIRIIIPNCTSYQGFNINDDNGYLGYYGGNPDGDGNIIIDVGVTGKTCLYMFTDLEFDVYEGERTGIKTIETYSVETLNTKITIPKVTDYTSMQANYVYNGTLENDNGGQWMEFALLSSAEFYTEGYYCIDTTNIIKSSGAWFNNGENSSSSVTFDVSEINNDNTDIFIIGYNDIYNYDNDNEAYVSVDSNITLSSFELSRIDNIATFSNIDIFTKESSKKLDLASVKSIAIKEGSDTDIVTIENNIITGSKAGTTTLLVTYVDDSTTEITVNVKTLAFSNATKSVNRDENPTIDLTSEVLSGTPISWESSNIDVAAIDETTGILTPIANGTTTITIKDTFGNQATMEVEITSKEVVQVDKTSVELETTDTHQITITNGANPKGYASNDEDVATVDETGLITAVGEGTTTITVTSQDDVPTIITVIVKNPTPVEISSSKSSLIIGESTVISVDNGAVTEWTSSNEKIATVDKDGNVTAIAEGIVTITANDKVGNSDTVDIEVKKFTINRDFLNLALDDTYTLKSDTSIIESFISADESVATVSDKGVVTAVGVGSTTITVEDTFGNKIDVPVSVFNDTDYTTGEVSTEEDEDGNTIFKINKGNATEIKLELSSHKYVYAQGVVSYWDSTTETNVEIPWVAEFNNGTTATVYIGNLPADVEELVFSVYYSAYWDNSIGDMVNADVIIDAVSGNAESTVTESILPKDILELKKHILGINLIDDTTKYDFNGDKSINILDLLYAKRLLLGIVE